MDTCMNRLTIFQSIFHSGHHIIPYAFSSNLEWNLQKIYLYISTHLKVYECHDFPTFTNICVPLFLLLSNEAGDIVFVWFILVIILSFFSFFLLPNELVWTEFEVTF